MHPMMVVVRVTLIFLLVALVAGGIAMLGNQLGRKIGRKKMTVFGMRPRHTSIFITTITGSLIAVMTLGMAMVASQDVRDIVTGSRERIEKLELRKNQLSDRVQELAEEVRKGTVIWNYGEHVALNTIPAGADELAVKNIIGVLLKKVNYDSLTKNNKIAIRQNEEPFGLETVLVKYSMEDLRQWVKDFTNLEKPVGLWVVVTENSLYRDPVPVTLQGFPVELLFKKDETVYEAELLKSEVLLNWHVFLRDMKQAALKKGMIEINDSLGGEFTAEELVEVSQAVENHTGKVRVKAIANRDLYRSSNLDVSIEVEPVVE